MSRFLDYPPLIRKELIKWISDHDRVNYFTVVMCCNRLKMYIPTDIWFEVLIRIAKPKISTSFQGPGVPLWLDKTLTKPDIRNPFILTNDYMSSIALLIQKYDIAYFIHEISTDEYIYLPNRFDIIIGIINDVSDLETDLVIGDVKIPMNQRFELNFINYKLNLDKFDENDNILEGETKLIVKTNTNIFPLTFGCITQPILVKFVSNLPGPWTPGLLVPKPGKIKLLVANIDCNIRENLMRHKQEYKNTIIDYGVLYLRNIPNDWFYAVDTD